MAEEIAIPETWEQLAKITDKAIRNLESMRKTPLPETVRAAVAGDFFATTTGTLETLLGHTSAKETREWGTRVMQLQVANSILRKFESEMVKAYVLSPASAFRLIYDGLTKIPHWIAEHLAELTLILLPLLLAGNELAGDAIALNIQIESRERAIDDQRKELARFYAMTPFDQSKPGRGQGGRLFIWDIRKGIKNAEDEISRLRREIVDLTKLLQRSNLYLEIALDAILVFLVYLSVQKLLNTASSIAEALVTLTPASKLRDAAIQEAKAKAFPQFPQKRKVIRKRSRRN